MAQQVFLHKPGQVEVELIEVEESITVEELIFRHGAQGHRAWAQDGDELIITAVVIEVIEEHGHIHIGPHGEIEVSVRHGEKEHSRDFKPGSRVQTVLEWADGEHGFNIPTSEKGNFALFIKGQKEPLDTEECIGVIATDHHLRLYLNAYDRPQG